MTVEVTVFGTYFAEGAELVEHEPFHMQADAELLVHLFDNQELWGRVLRADPTGALVEIDDRRWWLARAPSGAVGRWVAEAGKAKPHKRPKDHAEMI
jgi:hypothetical protein